MMQVGCVAQLHQMLDKLVGSCTYYAKVDLSSHLQASAARVGACGELLEQPEGSEPQTHQVQILPERD